MKTLGNPIDDQIETKFIIDKRKILDWIGLATLIYMSDSNWEANQFKKLKSLLVIRNKYE